MAPSSNKPTKTGKKDAKGRAILKGPQGGLFVMTAAGNRVPPARREFMTLNSMLTNHIQRSQR